MKNRTLEQLDIYGEGGGGGCFVAGTLISTPNGPKRIEQIVVGDQVFCYPESGGDVVVGTVYQTHKHPKEDNNSGLHTFTLDDETQLIVTGNHYILMTDGEFAYAGNFEIGDQFVDEYGETRTIVDVS